MQTPRLFNSALMVRLITLLLVLFVAACQDVVQDEVLLPDPASKEMNQDWVSQLDQLELESVVIVPQGASIQQAISAADPGDVIYVSPGIYREDLKINKSDLQLVGLNSNPTEKVVFEGAVAGLRAEFYNIEGSVSSRELPDITNARRGKRKCLMGMEREELGMGIAHYTFLLKVGEGEFDEVRVHRVVKEKRPYKPYKTKGNIFMVHGAIQNFDDIFFTAGASEINDQTSAPFYLALNGIDVWGIDLGWTEVPLETEDFTFMKGWGVEKDVQHTLKAITVARIIRGLTCQGFGRMNLLGFSYGIYVAYAAADSETQMHRIKRNLSGIIPVDASLKLEDPSAQAANCQEAANWKATIESGQYHNPLGVGVITLGNLAVNAPDDPSPIPDFAGLTNIQVLMAIGSDHSAGWHFYAGSPFHFDYTDPMRFARLCANLSPYMPAQIFYEGTAVACPTEDVAFDDHLSEIRIPIFSIDSGGRENGRSFYTTTLTSSNDVTTLIISLTEDASIDFGHADLWMAYEASTLVWEPLREWLLEH